MNKKISIPIGLLTVTLVAAVSMAWLLSSEDHITGQPAEIEIVPGIADIGDASSFRDSATEPEPSTIEPAPPDSGEIVGDSEPVVANFYDQVHVLCVGIDNFPRGSIESRRFLEQDAQDLAKLFRGRYGYRVQILTGAEAKKSAIEEAVQRLNAVGPNDAVILFFATHGKELDYSDKSGDPVQAGYLLPWDAPLDMNNTSKPKDWEDHAVSFAWLGDQIEASNARHVLVLLNTCHSGYIGLSQAGPARDSLESSVTNPSRAAITAGLSGQEAREPNPGERVTDTLNGSVLQNSHFTHYLLNALTTEDALGATELHAFLNQGLRDLTGNDATYAMWPQYRESSESTGEFVFIPRALDQASLDAAIERFNTRRLARWRNRIQPSEPLRILYTPDPAFAVDSDERKRQWQQRTKIYVENASLGDAEAMAALSHCFRLSLGVDEDPDAAYRWASSAYERGTGSGLYALARCYRDGVGVEANPILADRLLRQAVSLDYPAALYDESRVIHDQLAERSDTKSAEYQTQQRWRVELLRRSAEGGFGRACHELAMAYLHGQGGLVPDRQAVERWAEAAIEADDPMGHLALADLYTGQSGLAQTAPELAKEHLMASAQAGFSQAQYYVGMMMLGNSYIIPAGMTNPFSNNPTQGLKWLKLAADQDYDPAHFELGMVYAEGKHVRADHTLAVAYLRKAAEARNENAVFTLAGWYLQGNILGQDTARGIQLLHESADLGHATAQFLLGTFYYDGVNVETDRAKGLKYLSMACEQEMLPAVGTVCMILYYANPPWDIHQDNTAYDMWAWHAETRVATKAWDEFLDQYPEESDLLERVLLNGPELLIKFVESPGDSNARSLQNQLALRLFKKHAEVKPDLILTSIIPRIAERSRHTSSYLELLVSLDEDSGRIQRQLREADSLEESDPAIRNAIAEALSAIASAAQDR